jgi:hypothetical protein
MSGGSQKTYEPLKPSEGRKGIHDTGRMISPERYEALIERVFALSQLESMDDARNV